MDVSRRALIGGVAAAAGIGLVGIVPPAAASGRRPARAGRADGHGPREYVVTGAYVLTIDPARGDVADGEVRKRHGELVDVDADEVVRETEAALRALLAR